MTGAGEDEVDRKTASTLADTALLTGARCTGCGVVICGHQAVFSLVLGYKNAPRCLACVAEHMREAAVELRERSLTYVRHHDCFRAAWRRASLLEGFGEAERPACLWSNHDTAAVSDADVASVASDIEAGVSGARGGQTEEVADSWDAGNTGCGDLVLELRLRLRELAPGDLFELRATDAGAPIDLPAWCSLTGHRLVEARHPVYRIRRKA